jgi:adenosylmethionine-8-amino-7-oxononanoate aminotransferase
MGVRPNSIEARDVAHVLHPYTNAAAHEKEGPLIISHSDGTRVLGDTVCPPMIITAAQIEDLLARIKLSLDDTQAWLLNNGHHQG